MVEYIFEAVFCALYIVIRLRRCKQASYLMIILYASVFMLSSLSGAQYIVEVLKRSFGGYEAVVRCDATGADFGEDVGSFTFGINSTGCASFVAPKDACDEITIPQMNYSLCLNYFAVVPRHNCSFSEKAYHVQMAKPKAYKAVLIYNDAGYPPISMTGGKFAELIDIPVLMVSFTCMENMMGSFSAAKGYIVALRAIPGYFELMKYLVPLLSAIGFCFIVLFGLLIVRICRDRRRTAHKRLSKKNLKKLPVRKFRKGEQPETCIICLDDFVEGEKVRVLPCDHAYHSKCVDPWLTKNRKVCPICKRKVFFTGDSDSSDSESERRNAQSSDPSDSTVHENDPLLRNEQQISVTSESSTAYGTDIDALRNTVVVAVHADSQNSTNETDVENETDLAASERPSDDNSRYFSAAFNLFSPIVQKLLRVLPSDSRHDSTSSSGAFLEQSTSQVNVSSSGGTENYGFDNDLEDSFSTDQEIRPGDV